MLGIRRFANDRLAILCFVLLGLWTFLSFQGYSPTDSGLFLFVPAVVALLGLGSFSIFQSESSPLILLASVVQPLLVIAVVPFGLLSTLLGLGALAALFFVILNKIRPWILILLAMIPTALVAAMLSLFTLLGLFFPGGSVTYKPYAFSPDGSHQVILRESDQGALGGNVDIIVRQLYLFELIKHERSLYFGAWGERPKLEWLSNRRIKIDKHEFDIYRSPQLDTYNEGY